MGDAAAFNLDGEASVLVLEGLEDALDLLSSTRAICVSAFSISEQY